MRYSGYGLRIACFLTLTAFSRAARSEGYFEVTANGSYFHYNSGLVGNVPSYENIQRWGGGIAYRFLTNTSIELSYMNSTTTDRYGESSFPGFNLDTTKTLQIQNTSLNLVLDLMDRKARFRPYISGGGGVMNRTLSFKYAATDKITGSPYATPIPNVSDKYYSASADAGIGLKFFIAESVAIDASFNVYVTDLDKPDIFVNYSAAAGLRVLF